MLAEIRDYESRKIAHLKGRYPLVSSFFQSERQLKKIRLPTSIIFL